MLFILFYTSLSAIYGQANLNTVEIQDTDSYVVIETVEKPTNLRPINQSTFTTEKIPEDQYPWPDHSTSIGYLVTQESLQSLLYHCKASPDTTQNDIFWHPAGSKQFYAEDSMFKDSPRVKVKYFLNSKFNENHPTGLYVPPGELITVEIPENAINKIGYSINRQADTRSENRDRYDFVACTTIKFAHTINKFGWPIGGYLELTCKIDDFPGGVELNISGCIEMPFYRYGVTTEENWQSTISQRKAPLALFDAGTVLSVVPTTLLTPLSNLDSTLAFWRTMAHIHYSFNELTTKKRRPDGRVQIGLLYGFGSFITRSYNMDQRAVAILQDARVEILPSYMQGMLDYNAIKDGSFTQHHEMSHFFQDGWGYGARDDWLERTTDVQVFADYALMSTVSGRRQPSHTGNFECYRFYWENSIHQHIDIGEITDTKFNYIQFYNAFQYYFGTAKYREFLRCHIKQQYYKRSSTMPHLNELLLHACKIFNRDLRAYFKTFSRVFTYDETNFPQANEHLVTDMGLKEFHPVSLLYQSGYVVDGVEFETARPYRIIAHEPYTFNFVSQMKSRSGMHSFTFKEIRGDSKSKFQEISTGVYKYTPDHQINDKIYVDYTDTETQEVTTCVVSIKQIFNGTKLYFMQGQRSLLSSANYLAEHKDEAKVMIGEDPMTIPVFKTHEGLRNQVWMAEGIYYAPKAGTYKFLLTHRYTTIAYFSTTQLPNENPTSRSYVGQNSATDGQSQAITLSENQACYYRICTMYSSAVRPSNDNNNPPYVSAKYQIQGDPNKYELEYERSLFNGCTLSDRDDKPFEPVLEKDETLGIFFDDRHVFYNSINFKVLSNLNGIQNTEKLFNGDITDSETKVTGAFPISYKIDMNKTRNVNSVFLHSGSNRMVSNLQIKCDDTEVFTGKFSSEENFFANFTPNTKDKCRVIEIIVKDNEEGQYSDFNEIQPCLYSSSSRNIIPATHSNFNANSYLSASGVYYNGKGIQLNEGDSLSFTLQLNQTGDSFGIVGDKSLSGGSFDVYVDGEYKSHVTTNSLSPKEYSSISGSKYYQVPLFGILNLSPNSKHTIDIKTVKGTTGISGLLADGNLVNLESSTISSSPSHSDEEDFELYKESENPITPVNPEPKEKTPEPTKESKPVNPVIPEVKTPEPTKESNKEDPSGESTVTSSPNPGDDQKRQEELEKKKKIYIGVGAGLGVAAVIAAVSVAAVFVIKAHSKGYERKVGDEEQENCDL